MIKLICAIAPALLLIIVNPAFAILGLPESNDNATASTPSSQRTMNGFSLYQNDMFGFTIQYPSDWRIDERNQQQPSYLDPNNQNPVLEANNIVNFLSSNKTQAGFDSAESGVEIYYLPIAKYLDTNDLKVKTKTAHDYVTVSINYMNSGESSKPGLGFQLFLKPVKSMPTREQVTFPHGDWTIPVAVLEVQHMI